MPIFRCAFSDAALSRRTKATHSRPGSRSRNSANKAALHTMLYYRDVAGTSIIWSITSFRTILRPQFSSASRFTAGTFGFLTLTQCGERPERYGEPSLRLVTGFDRKSLVSLSIEDSGPGITAENQDHIFDPFFTTKPTGMGMGLSICRSIIETHGGRLRLARTNHRGPSFEITLPIVQQTGSPADGGG
jgi:hypothetical protein